MIEVSGKFRLQPTEKGKPLPTSDDVTRAARRIASDAVVGTFAELRTHPWWLNKWVRRERDLIEVEPIEVQDDGNCTFQFRLAESLFPCGDSGLQHLIGILAGDVLSPDMLGVNVEDFTVQAITPSESWRRDHERIFRNTSNSTDEIRQQFHLDERTNGFSRPLLAFSFKPRVNIAPKHFRKIVLDVLGAGFDIVELDTRNLELSEPSLTRLLEIGYEATQVTKRRTTRLSPNFSIAPPRCVELVEQFARVHADGPVVVKIDGGLDGISACQAVRRQGGYGLASATDVQPIITSYPLLRDAFQKRVPAMFFIDALSMSGADIIYPGGWPRVRGSLRTLGAAREGEILAALERYRRMAARAWPMFTISGGVTPGQLHVLFEMLGPRIAFFLGGAVALHQRGPLHGARLCANIIEEAARLSKEASEAGNRSVADLPLRLLEEIAKNYPDIPPRLVYVSPQDEMKKYPFTSWRSPN